MSNFAINSKSDQGIQSPMNMSRLSSVIRPLSIDGQPVKNETMAEHRSTIHFWAVKKLSELTGNTIVDQVTPASARTIFQARNFAVIKDNEDELNVLDLNRAFIVRATVKSTANDFPFPVRFNCSAFGNLNSSFDTSGRSSAVVIHSGENLKQNTVVHDVSAQLNHEMIKKYGHLDSNDLEKNIQTLIGKDGVPINLVSMDHPIVTFMKKNPNDYTVPNEKNAIEGMYRMNPVEVNAAIRSLKSNVVERFNSTDLSTIKGSFDRVDGRELRSITGTNMEHLDSSIIDEQKNKVCKAHVELQIDWTTPRIISNQSRGMPLDYSPTMSSPKRLPMGDY